MFYVEILSIMPDYAPMLLGPIMLKIMLAESSKAYSTVTGQRIGMTCLCADPVGQRVLPFCTHFPIENLKKYIH